MKIKVYINKSEFSAMGFYSNGTITVQKGSTINPAFAPYIKGISFARNSREDKQIVDENWKVQKDHEFPSPSTAAQFVMGQSRDGYDAWKVEDGRSLGQYLEEHGLRERKRRKKG